MIAETTDGLVPNQTVLKLDAHQPEFTETWATYSSHVLSASRINAGRAKLAAEGNLVAAVTSRFGVAAGPLLGIWGGETNYGKTQGDFSVVDALTTLAWSRASRYFENEVIAAMRIVAAGQAPAGRLIGSYAGAMGQPQFMPSVYLSTAVSFAGASAPDIWGSDADSLASIANYLVKAGWRPGEPAMEPVFAPRTIRAAITGRQKPRSAAFWRAQGVQQLPGSAELPAQAQVALLLPDGPGGQAFFVYPNFNAIRRYNPSDFYALAVSALGRNLVGE